MSKSEVLQEFAREVRQDTLKILAATDNSWNTWAPDGTSNHILWHAGHAGWLQDLMCIEPLTGKSELPEGWAATSEWTASRIAYRVGQVRVKSNVFLSRSWAEFWKLCRTYRTQLCLLQHPDLVGIATCLAGFFMACMMRPNTAARCICCGR